MTFEVSSKFTPPPSKPTENRGPNSNSHFVQITTIRLNGDNFLHWHQSVCMCIRGREKIGYMAGGTKVRDLKDMTYATGLLIPWMRTLPLTICAIQLPRNFGIIFTRYILTSTINPKCMNCNYSLEKFDMGETSPPNTSIFWKGYGRI